MDERLFSGCKSEWTSQMKFSIRFKNAVKEAFGVFLLACLLGFIFNAASDKGVALIAEPRVLNQAPDSLLTESIDSLEIPGEGFEEPRVITLEQAYRLYTSKKVLFIDARKKQLYEKGHITGAINIPWLGPEKKAKIPGNLPKEQMIVTYCEGSECDSAVELAFFLLENGYYFVHIFYDGWEEWEKGDYPSE